MPRHHTLAQFEFFVLLAVEHLGDRAYGVSIRRLIEARSEREAALGAVYMALRRLEEKGLLTHRMGEPERARGGRARKFFRLTPTGVTKLREAEETILRMMGRTGEVGR